MNHNDSVFLRKLLDTLGAPSLGKLGTYRNFLGYLAKEPHYRHLLDDPCVKVTIGVVDELLVTKTYSISCLNHTIQSVLQRTITALLETQPIEAFYHKSVKLLLSRIVKDNVVLYELKATGEVENDGCPEYSLAIGDLTLRALNVRYSHFYGTVKVHSHFSIYRTPECALTAHHQLMEEHAGITKPGSSNV